MKSESVVKIDNHDTIAEKLTKFSADPSNLYAACIYKVSQKLRNANEAAYTPRLVSIGPLYHGKFQGMEGYKLRFLNNFLTRFGIGLETLLKFAAEKESFVRGCYVGTVNLSTDMILLDGIFIVELFLESRFIQLRDRNEIVFRNQWMKFDLLHDLLLLENQLPMSIMDELLAFVDFSFLNEGIKLNIYDLARNFFQDVGNTQNKPLTEDCSKARHFVEFLLILHAPENPKEEPASARTKVEYSRSATELYQAGVKFSKREGNCFFDVKFDPNKGELTIPKLIVNDTTETFFRNLIAFEQCGYCGYYSEDITSYVILMDRFIDTHHDVDLLVKSGIIVNKLGGAQKVAALFNNLHKEVVTEANIFYFNKLCGDLNKYSRDPFHQWKAKCFEWNGMLRRNYFSNPWTFISVVAASMLLILTVIQTVCSILQVK